MKIFIDHQFRTIYNGEFKHWVEFNIINPLKEHDLTISNSESESNSLLRSNDYDIVIVTGYSLSSLVAINLKENTKIFSIVYDMNSEKLFELFDSDYLGDIIASKSRLIFLSHVVIVPTINVKREIVSTYANYKEYDIEEKIEVLKCGFAETACETKKLIDKKYVFITSSLNSGTFLLDDFSKIITDINAHLQDLPDIKFVLYATEMPKGTYEEINKHGLLDKFILIKELNESELASLYKYSICTFFISSLEANISEVYKAYEQETICVLNSLNDMFVEYFSNCGVFYEQDQDIIQSIKHIMKSDLEAITNVKLQQLEGMLINLLEDKNKSILEII